MDFDGNTSHGTCQCHSHGIGNLCRQYPVIHSTTGDAGGWPGAFGLPTRSWIKSRSPLPMPKPARIIALLVVIAWTGMSCNKEEPIPSWVIVPEYQVVTTTDQERTGRNHGGLCVHDVQFLGVFLCRPRFPILENGMTTLICFRHPGERDQIYPGHLSIP